MQKRGIYIVTASVLLSLLVVFSMGSGVLADSSSESDNYRMTNMSFGGGISSGDSSSDNYRITSSGQNSPSLEIILDPGESDLGKFSTDETSTKTSTIKVRNFGDSSGYTVKITGDPPTYDHHQLQTPSEPTKSQVGVEQFGINLVANTDPEVGDDPTLNPSGASALDQIDSNYSTQDKFMYKSGEQIASVTGSSEQSVYTITFIVNISGDTPAGHYHGDYSVIVVPKY